MKIKSIEYENFRNFRDYGTIKCSTDGKVTIIYGKNGDGKTTLHQLFQWIFYGQVKFNKTTTDHLYNLAFESEQEYGSVFDVMGRIDFEHDGSLYSLTRKYTYRKGLDDSEKIGEDLSLQKRDEDYNWKRVDRPVETIEKMLPSGLSEYFFFDGESMIADLRVKGKDSAGKLRKALYSMQYKNPWGYSNQELLTLYRGATADNECPMMVEKNLPSCGKSRFGCWVCTMVEKDKSMEAMIANDDEKSWMSPLLEFRNRFGDEEHDRERRSFKKMQGYLQGSYGQLHHGPYKKEIREQWLKELLEIQVGINTHGPEEFSDLELITLPELRCIRRIWVFDKHEFDDSLPDIYESVMHKPFSDPEWIGSEVYGSNEWEILKQTCRDLFPDEELAFEMMYSLIDIENQANSVNQRKGILDTLETCVKQNFYRDEDDATDYYTKQLQRKKTMGGKFNEKFFAHIQDEGEEFEDVSEEADHI